MRVVRTRGRDRIDLTAAWSFRATVASACLVGLLITGCQPTAAVRVDAGPPVTAQADCSSSPLAVSTVPARPVAAATAAVRITAVAVAQAQAGATAARTSVPRDELVTQAVATATAQAHLPRTATPTPRPGPSPPPITYSMCVTPTGSPGAGARLVAVVVTPIARPIQPAIAVAPIASPSVTLQNPRVLLASDASSEVVLHVGDRFVLLLGDYSGGTDWHIQLSEPAVLRKAGDDGQGLYEARTTGETQLVAIGSPTCLSATPRCAALTRLVRFAIRVL